MQKPNICKIEDIKELLCNSFKRNSIIPLFGSGITAGSRAYSGVVPTGNELKDDIKSILLESNELTNDDKIILDSENSLQNLAVHFENTEIISSKDRKSYYKNHFSNVQMSSLAKLLFDIDWNYVYSLNIDDAIETNSIFKTVVTCNRPVEDEIFNNNHCVVKLHGDITEYLKYKNECIIFSSNEYARSLLDNESLLKRLKTDCSTNTLLIIGCSLTNEFDLMNLKDIPVNEKSPLTENRKIICVKGKPSKLSLSNYQLYGITDIVVFDSYEDIYTEINQIWKDSKSIDFDMLSDIKNLNIIPIPAEEKINQPYFYQGKSLIDYSKHSVNIPSFFIIRDLLEKIKLDSKIHLIHSYNYSGKTYFLVSILRKFKNYETYFFESKNTISSNVFNILQNKRNCLLIFDNNSISEAQLQLIISNAYSFEERNITIIISLTNDDEDIYAFLRYRMKKIKPEAGIIIEHRLEKFLSETEFTSINHLLPAVGIPVFNPHATILDNLISAEDRMNISDGRFANVSLRINDTDEIMLLIILAVKEDITMYDLIYFGLDKQMYQFLYNYPKFFEKMQVLMYEKECIDNSDIKFIINSKYWLRRELGKFISESKYNRDKVVEAYERLIKKIISRSTDKVRIRRMYKSYIYFDIVNKIFLTEKKGQMNLIAQIYKRIYPLLADDYQFLHQYAKCYLSYVRATRDEQLKKERIREALNKINIAISVIEAEIKYKDNERLETSLAHLEYTKATILCEYNKINKNDEKITEDVVIETLYVVLQNPLNLDDFKTNRINSDGIRNYISYRQRKNYSGKKPILSPKAQQQFQEILTWIYESKKKYFL